jgi:hypothetical protein
LREVAALTPSREDLMGKLRLELDQLTVDSFDTSVAQAEKGTVFGEQCTCYTACTCPGCETCDHTACNQETCQTCQTCQGQGYSCDPSCNELSCGGGHTCDFESANMYACCPY